MINLLAKNNEGGYDFTNDFKNALNVSIRTLKEISNIIQENHQNKLNNEELKLLIAELSYNTFFGTMTSSNYNKERTYNDIGFESIKGLYEELFKLGYEANQIFLIIELASREVFLNKLIVD